MLDWVLKMLGLEKRATKTASGHPSSYGDPVLNTLFGGGGNTASGLEVTPDTAMRLSSVYSCVRVITEDMMTLPCVLHERVKVKGKPSTRHAVNHPLYSLLHDRPNEWMNPVEFWEVMIPSIEARGNMYSEKEFNGAGRVVNIWPWHPDLVTPKTKGKRLWYDFQTDKGPVILPPEKVLHIRMLPGRDGVTGTSVIEQLSETVGLGQAAELYSATFFGNGASPDAVVQVKGRMDPKDKESFRQDWKARFGGVFNKHDIAVIDQEAEFKHVGISPEDAQLIETRKFSVVDIARAYRIPLPLLGDLDRATFANISELMIAYWKHSIRPRVIRIEKALDRSLLSPAERGRFFFKFNTDALLRGDFKTRTEGQVLQVLNGLRSRNEIRMLDDVAPYEGGDVMLIPLNEGPVGGDGDGVSRATRDLRASHSELETREVEDREARVVEVRASSRFGLRKSFRGAIEDAAGRLVRREVREIRKAVKEHLDSRSRQGFDAFLEEFYGGTAPAFVNEVMGPVLRAYGESVGGAALKEIGAEAVDLQSFLDGYLETFGVRHSAKQRRKLQKALEDVEDRAGAIDGVLTRWLEGDSTVAPLAENIAKREEVRMGEGITRHVWRSSGVTLIRWVAVGENCPLCDELDGNVVGIDAPFAGAGDVINPNKEGQAPGEGTASLKLKGDVFSPPLHDGCDCTVTRG